MKDSDIIRVAAVSPILKVADPEYNANEIIECAKTAAKKSPDIILFPELCITSSSCGDLFYQEDLYDASVTALRKILRETGDCTSIIIAGSLLKKENRLYNCAFVIQGGRVLGIVPKKSGFDKCFCQPNRDPENNNESPDPFCYDELFTDAFFGDTVFKANENSFSYRIEIGSDISDIYDPDNRMPSDIVFNPSAMSAHVDSDDELSEVITSKTLNENNAYVCIFAGPGESTTDSVRSGLHLAALRGDILHHSDSLETPLESSVNYIEIDLGYIDQAIAESNIDSHIECPIYKNPFMPDYNERRCKRIFDIQTAALVKRLSHIGSKKLVIGISGGLDSTVSLLVAVEAMNKLGKDPQDIIAVTMPGFGTSDATYENAKTLMDLLKCDTREISIKNAVTGHFKDIGHDPDKKDLTYENAQARERTQILMDLAGDESGMMLGTGDMSELALGWCTYGGDHMSMYCINAGVPKTVLPYIIRWYTENRTKDKALIRALKNVVSTPISPELLPPDSNGEIKQKTEETIGPYELHDFFMYHSLKYGFRREKIQSMAVQAFKGYYSEKEIKKWLGIYYKRFISQQYKRNCMPDGPRVFDISLSPHGGLDMPSDASAAVFAE